MASVSAEVPIELSDRIPIARANGIKWLIQNRGPDGLWTSGALSDFLWDRPFTSAWVLHRLAQTVTLRVDSWRQCLDEATFEMIQQALDSGTWRGSTENQRYRVESRIAAAAARMRQVPTLSTRSAGTVHLYLGSWKERARDWVGRLPLREWDVGTSTFLLNALVSAEDLPKLAQNVLKAEARGRRRRGTLFDQSA